MFASVLLDLDRDLVVANGAPVELVGCLGGAARRRSTLERSAGVGLVANCPSALRRVACPLAQGCAGSWASGAWWLSYRQVERAVTLVVILELQGKGLADEMAASSASGCSGERGGLCRSGDAAC